MANMFSKSVSVITILVLFALQDVSVQATSSPTIKVTVSPASSSVFSQSAPSQSLSASQSRTPSSASLGSSAGGGSSPMTTAASTTVASTTVASTTVASSNTTSSGSTAAGGSASVTTAAPTTGAPRKPTSSGSTAAGGSASVTTASPTTGAPRKPTCSNITFVVKMAYNEGIKYNRDNVTRIIRDSLFNDSSKYDDVKVSDLMPKKKGEGEVFFTFTLCLVFLKDDAGFIEVMIKNFKLFGDKEVTELEIKVIGVKTTPWKVKEGECSKCSEGGAGPIGHERTCVPEPTYSCRGVQLEKEFKACLTECDSNAAATSIPSCVLAMGILLFLSFHVWK